MKKILIVDDDDFFRSAVRSILNKKYEVIEANNGKMAKELLLMVSVDLIISDIQMPHFTGVDLLDWVKKNKNIPVILMTGFSQILETQRAHELGAEDFLAKPFEESEMIAKVKKVFKEETVTLDKPLDPVDLDKEFCKLSIEDFVSEKEADYAIFIRVSSSKYIKIAHKGGKISADKIAAFKEKGLEFLYIKQEDFSKLVGFTLLVSKAVSSSGQVDRAKKVRFLQYTGEMIVQKAFVAGTDEALFKNAKDFLATSLDLLTEDKESFSLLSMLDSHTDYLYAHSLGVSMFSVMIAKQMGWQAPQTLFKVAFAGLFHDIGKKEISREILEKSRAVLTQEERKIIETHTTRGKEILESLRTAPSEVVQVAYEHHEDMLGQGYPQGIERSRIHPLTLVISVANTFCNYTIKNPQHPNPVSGHEAIMNIKKFKLPSLDHQCFEALTKVIK